MTESIASVIIPVFNRPVDVIACLKSIVIQDFEHFEIIVVDDSSTDDTPERLEAFRQTRPDIPITIVRNDRNLGVSGSRNTGIRAASGRYVAFIDSDCIADKGWLGALVARLEQGDVQAVGGTTTSPEPINLAERAYLGSTSIQETTRRSFLLIGCNMAFRRDLALNYLFDDCLEYCCDEDDFCWRICSDGCRVGFAPDAEVCHYHRFTLRSYLEQSRRHGRGAGRYWYKRGIYVGRDLVFGFLAVFTLPFGLIDSRLLVIPFLFAMLQLGAIGFNEMRLKGKGLLETVCVFPISVMYQIGKAWSVMHFWLRMIMGSETAIRRSKMQWKHRSSDIKSAKVPREAG